MSIILKKRVLHVGDSRLKEMELELKELYPESKISNPNDYLTLTNKNTQIEAVPRERFPYYVRGRQYDKIVFSFRPSTEELDIAFMQVLYKQGCVFHDDVRVTSAARFGGDYERRKKFAYQEGELG